VFELGLTDNQAFHLEPCSELHLSVFDFLITAWEISPESGTFDLWRSFVKSAVYISIMRSGPIRQHGKHLDANLDTVLGDAVLLLQIFDLLIKHRNTSREHEQPPEAAELVVWGGDARSISNIRADDNHWRWHSPIEGVDGDDDERIYIATVSGRELTFFRD
jgi:hypothetical protein